MSDEKKNDKFEEICQHVFKKYPVNAIESMKNCIDSAAIDAEAAILLANDGRNKLAAKAAMLSIVKAPLTAITGIGLAAAQVVVGTVVLPVSLVGMALEKTQESASEPETKAAPAAE